ILANPKTCLILDEPTTDLDMDTLDMLEEVLSAYTGTLIVVSHDRDFLDQTVTKILAFEGNGRVELHIGGYSDYLHAKTLEDAEQTPVKNISPAIEKPQAAEPATAAPIVQKPRRQLTYKLEHELKQLPQKIEKLESEVALCDDLLADAGFYARDADAFHETVKKLADLKTKLERYENRWLEIEAMKSETE
ncbi:MAG: ABC transporter family protein, partial [Alphaproteobacteria bacterium]|nr:ABC transporter family protein [Alphaproteobacteria bacterium]